MPFPPLHASDAVQLVGQYGIEVLRDLVQQDGGPAELPAGSLASDVVAPRRAARPMMPTAPSVQLPS